MSVSTRGQDGQQRFRGMATELRFQTADKFEKEDKKQMRRLVSRVVPAAARERSEVGREVQKRCV